jgi:hypothetical protein
VGAMERLNSLSLGTGNCFVLQIFRISKLHGRTCEYSFVLVLKVIKMEQFSQMLGYSFVVVQVAKVL